MFRTIEKQAEGIIVEKKSKFIANIFYVENVKEAEDIIEKTRKKYYDARHNCYAYRIIQEDNVVERQSDDGEPQGTAGAPMLNILSKKELKNVIVIVTRYFGGILLGTGGLVKAYSEALNQAIKNAKEVEKEEGYVAQIDLEYEKQREFEYMCEKNKIKIVNKEYTEKIKNTIEISKEDYEEKFQTNGKNRKIIIKENKFINKHK